MCTCIYSQGFVFKIYILLRPTHLVLFRESESGPACWHRSCCVLTDWKN